MDVCHLLLGCPWQYDRSVIHDRYRNTYAFVKNSVKITLGPSKVGIVPKPFKGKGNNFLTSNVKRSWTRRMKFLCLL